MISRAICIIVCLCLTGSRLLAQTDSIPASLDQAIEDLILGTETDGQIDYSYITDQLQAWLEHPLDLNKASSSELRLLPEMDDLLVNRLLNHIQRFGPLISIYELQAVAGFPIELCHMIKPFVMVASKSKDLDPGNKHPQGPSFDQITKGSQFEIIQRLSWILEEQRGYTAPDTNFRSITDEEGRITDIDTILSSRYSGSPYRIFTRIAGRYSPNVSFSLLGEKDPGEVFSWNPASKQLGYDFLSSHFHLRDFGRLKRLVIGDYNIQTGQGLVLSRGLGFGKGAQVISSIKMGNQGVVPYRSVNENQFQRGVAATFAFGDIYLTGFYSRLHIDANLNRQDTLTDEALFASSLRLGGLHRTDTERSIRKSVQENLVGGRVEYKSPTLTLGTTHYYQHFGNPLLPAPNDYNIFDFSGDRNYLNGFDFDWVKNNMNIFGEVARSRSGGYSCRFGYDE